MFNVESPYRENTNPFKALAAEALAAHAEQIRQKEIAAENRKARWLEAKAKASEIIWWYRLFNSNEYSVATSFADVLGALAQQEFFGRSLARCQAEPVTTPVEVAVVPAASLAKRLKLRARTITTITIWSGAAIIWLRALVGGCNG